MAEKVRGGHVFLEGPVWVAEPGYLLLSEMREGTGPDGVQPSAIRRYTPPDEWDTFVADAGSNGLALSADAAHVVAATHDRRAISSFRLLDGERTVLAGDHEGRAFHSPNDLAVRSDGTVYFSDPDYQRGRRADEMGGRTGVYRITGGRVHLIDDRLRQPNGVALSPDGASLYVAATAEDTIYRYEVRPDGSTGQRSVFATMSTPDGAAVDCAGNVYWASYDKGTVHVFAPDGRQLGTVRAGRHTTNAAFGDADRRTLYLTSGTWGDFGLYRVRLDVPGYAY